MRRRPLLRAAVVGGGAYVAGKKVAQHSAEQSAQESGQDARISNLEQQGGSQQGGAPQDGAQQAGQADTPISEQLKQLTALHEDGSLNDAEFSAAKRKLLG
ncbi:MAG: SHOCT domain-containing protein, partial [Streptosporangiaceae bacterium]